MHPTTPVSHAVYMLHCVCNFGGNDAHSTCLVSGSLSSFTMEWKRETEFRQLLTAQIKHLTKDGLDTLAQLATSDMAEV